MFISYRRSDSAGFAGRIADYFAYRYPNVPMFFDATAIEPGEDFIDSIDRGLMASAVVLVPIGETWLDVRDATGGRRIDNPDDFVRREVSMALAREVRVVPVLLDNAQMPSVSSLPDDLAPLGRCHAQLLRHAAFARDVQYLGEFVVSHLEGLTVGDPMPSADSVPPMSDRRAALVSAFDTFEAEWPPGAWMICDTPSGAFVQFLRDSADRVILDLPVEQLDSTQRLAAQRFVTEDHGGVVAEGIALQLTLPMEPSYLAHLTRHMFRQVWGTPDDVPLTITLAGDGIEPVQFPLDTVERAQSDDPAIVLIPLAQAFESFCRTPSNGFMICENPEREIVQFSRLVTDDFVTLDLPTLALTPKQIVAAERELEWERGARRAEPTEGGNFSYQLDLAPDPGLLAALTLELFDRVYGRRPTAPLAVESGRW